VDPVALGFLWFQEPLFFPSPGIPYSRPPPPHLSGRTATPPVPLRSEIPNRGLPLIPPLPPKSPPVLLSQVPTASTQLNLCAAEQFRARHGWGASAAPPPLFSRWIREPPRASEAVSDDRQHEEGERLLQRQRDDRIRSVIALPLLPVP
jgi:hypothetical protein